MKKPFLLILILVAGTLILLNMRYGAGSAYPDLSRTPEVDESLIEVALSYPEPVGNVAVSEAGRIFFTVHPESRPKGNRLLEWVDGAAEPYPSGALQSMLFDTVLGLYIDDQNRLWSIDHGNHGFGKARVLAFDLGTNELVHDHTFDRSAAPAGSMLQDLRVSADGNHAFIADASIWRQSPAIVVYDIRSRQARRVLESHPSVSAEDYLIQTETGDMAWLGGLVSLKAGVDGLALDTDNDWLYYGAINQSGLYRVPVAALVDPALPDRQVAGRVERVGDKPLSDGIRFDGATLLITDVEHGAVHALEDGSLSTLIRSSRIRWADNLDIGPDGSLYLADSAIPDLVLKTSEHIQSSAPYYVFRIPSAALAATRSGGDRPGTGDF